MTIDRDALWEKWKADLRAGRFLREKFNALLDDIERQRGDPKIYDAATTAWQADKTYLVFVRGRGWTDGEYSTGVVKGWCHKWALDGNLMDAENRGVTHFAEIYAAPSESSATGQARITAAPSEEVMKIAQAAVERSMNDTRTAEQKIADGVAFICDEPQGPGVADVYEVYSAINGPARSAEQVGPTFTAPKGVSKVNVQVWQSGPARSSEPQERETPRTDDIDDKMSPDMNGHQDWKFAYFHLITVSRQLERELSQAREQIAETQNVAIERGNDLISARGQLAEYERRRLDWAREYELLAQAKERAEQQLAEYKKDRDQMSDHIDDIYEALGYTKWQAEQTGNSPMDVIADLKKAAIAQER